MPVQEFECQIARGQIGRYLNGEGLSSEALRQLGAHVAECGGCKSFLDIRKATLQGVLGEAPIPEQPSTRAVVEMSPKETLIAHIRAKSAEDQPDPSPKSPTKPTKPVITKPVIYCGALAVVLVGMTYLSKSPTGFLGPHADTSIRANSAPTEKPATPAEQSPLTAPSNAKADSPTVKPPPATHAAAKAENQSPTSSPAPKSDAPTTDAPVAAPSGGELKGKTTAPGDADSAEASKSPAPAIDPAAKNLRSPIVVDSAKPQPKKQPAISHPRSHRAAKRYGFLHLKSGTGAIHVYTHTN